MQMAMSTVDAPIDYINTHGTSTPVGDIAEMKGVREVFGENAPAISSTKSLSGHSLGAAGVHEAIYCMLMMEGNFIAGSANIEELDPAVADMPILTKTREDAKIDTVMSNSFGFGGTNATLVLKRWAGK
jgi:3-oxoacyl-[acyl-carrier-protein] synthase-1